MNKDFLFELGCEELPPGSLKSLVEALKENIRCELNKAELSFETIKTYASPRRLAILVKDLQSAQKNREIEKRGPALKAAFDNNGEPTKACLGFAKSLAISVKDLTTLETDKGSWVIYKTVSKGQPTENLLPDMIEQAVKALPLSKPMRWGNFDFSFLRPVHWILALYGDKVVPFSLFGLQSDNKTYGHRFHSPKAISLSLPQTYEEKLAEAKVIADFAKRRQVIIEQIKHLANELNATPCLNDALLDEVTAIVEWPNALVVSFDKDFLTLPSEPLIAAMESHQKCFALKHKEKDELLAKFITVSNIESLQPALVIHGNEKVMQARLSDAKFFYDKDCSTPLSQHVAMTQKVIFQTKLGTLYDKTLREQKVAAEIADLLKADPCLVKRALTLSKCDLMTEMVKEFPELQGYMGKYYALNDKEPKDVAYALFEQYLPRFSTDLLPSTKTGLILALSARLDNLLGIFAIGQKPTGAKDPFKLRRAALGIVRLLIENQVRLGLDELLELTRQSFKNIEPPKQILIEVKQFILDRLTAYYQKQGMSIDKIKAVLRVQDNILSDFDKRLNAIIAFCKHQNAPVLANANKRVGKLLAQQANFKATKVEEKLLELHQEQRLFSELKAKAQKIKPLMQQGDYKESLEILASLAEPIDSFFDSVMVMVEEADLRRNRLNLLYQLQALFMQVADISELQL